MKENPASPEAREILAAVSYFRGLDPRAFESVIRSAFSRDYEPGQMVILEGEPASGLFVVQHGWLKVSKIAVEGREQILQFLGGGEVFNAVSVFSGAPNQATVTALEATRLWIIRRETMLHLLDTNPQIARWIIQDLAGRISHLIGLVEDLSLRTVEARLARLLLEKANRDWVDRKSWGTQNEIASRLGTVPDVVSRTLRKMAERGLIEIARSEILLLNRPELEAIARIES